MSQHSYQQPTKNNVREWLLPSAIQRLTAERDQCCLVRAQELAIIVKQFLNLLPVRLREFIGAATEAELASWLAYHKSEVGTKTPASLKVLYLCGPEPLNDLTVMMEQGINPHNVWAITDDDADRDSAVLQCASNGIPLKIYCGSLNEFLETFNQSFDIIYFDACGPFCGGKPNTLDPIITLFERQRLNSPGALITNFCAPPDDGKSRKRFVDLITAYYAPRQRDAPRMVFEGGLDPQVYQHEPEWLEKFTSENLEALYSEFISAFLTDLGMTLLPNCRALSLGPLFRSYLGQESSYREIINKTLHGCSGSDVVHAASEIDLVPSAYPLMTFLRAFKNKHPNDVLLMRLAASRQGSQKTNETLLEAASILNAVVEGHWDALSESMLHALALSWFDAPHRITCDIPMPNLLINSLLGIFGRPWFVNPRMSKRATYVAKTRRMYCDLMILDQCRSYYDWFPTLEACEGRFTSIPFQILARSILDRIGRHNFSRETHPFQGSSVIGWNENPVAEWYELSDRVELC
jgi:hypothetical protein